MQNRIFVISFICLFLGVSSVRITDLRVPSLVRNGSGIPAVLDCDYSLGQEDLDSDSGLVVKWFFNKSPEPVYQWIIGKKPQELGILKGKLNLKHRMSNNNHTMHRALYIVNPTTELSGEYKCSVSTFQEEDFMEKTMIVYVPEEEFKLISLKKTDVINALVVMCFAEGVYPEPELALYRDSTSRTDDVLAGMRLMEWANIEKSTRHGVYDIVGTASLTSSEFVKPTTFICKLRVPATKYSAAASAVFAPDSKSCSQQLKAKQQLFVVTLLSLTLINMYCWR